VQNQKMAYQNCDFVVEVRLLTLDRGGGGAEKFVGGEGGDNSKGITAGRGKNGVEGSSLDSTVAGLDLQGGRGRFAQKPRGSKKKTRKKQCMTPVHTKWCPTNKGGDQGV